jgi:uncharacterized protein (DUF2336 family)
MSILSAAASIIGHTDFTVINDGERIELSSGKFVDEATMDAIRELALIPLPVYPTLESALRAKTTWIDAFTASITGTVPADEKLSWGSKAAAARALLAGTATPSQMQMIGAEAAVRNIEPSALAQIIAGKASQYEVIIAKAAGLNSVVTRQLEAATDPDEYKTILANAAQTAQAMLASMNVNP